LRTLPTFFLLEEQREEIERQLTELEATAKA
jgi:hypothetical protein